MRNLENILSTAEIDKIKQSLLREITLLHSLGMSHFQFARSLEAREWRQRSSRFYYAAYNVKRALSLCDNGKFSTDVSDHQQIDSLPLKLANYATHSTLLKNLRDDRNIADYSHLATVGDLIIQPTDAESVVANFINDVNQYLQTAGVKL